MYKQSPSAVYSLNRYFVNSVGEIHELPLNSCQREAFHGYQLLSTGSAEICSAQKNQTDRRFFFSNQALLIRKPATLEKPSLSVLSQLDAWIKSEGFWEMFHLPNQIPKVEVRNWLSIIRLSSVVPLGNVVGVGCWLITASLLGSVPSLRSPASQPVR